MKSFNEKLKAVADKLKTDNFRLMGGDKKQAVATLETAIGSVFNYMNAQTQMTVMPSVLRELGMRGQEYHDECQRYTNILNNSETDLKNAMYPLNVIYSSIDKSEKFFDPKNCQKEALGFTQEFCEIVSKQDAEWQASPISGVKPYDRKANTRRIIENILPESEDESYQP